MIQLNICHVEVMWSLLSPEEARGVILNYTLTYTNGPDTRKTISVPPTQNRAVLGELKPGENYSVYVSASTSAGMGNSTATTATLHVDNIPVDNTPGELKPYIYYLFFLVWVDVHCYQVIVSSTKLKTKNNSIVFHFS